jgi:hypothetical protein
MGTFYNTAQILCFLVKYSTECFDAKCIFIKDNRKTVLDQTYNSNSPKHTHSVSFLVVVIVPLKIRMLKPQPPI